MDSRQESKQEGLQTTSFTLIGKVLKRKQDIRPSSVPMPEEIQALKAEMDALEAKLEQVNYRLLVATHFTSGASEHLEKFIYNLFGIVSNTKTIQNYLTNLENKNGTHYHFYALRLSTILLNLRNNIDKSGMFPIQVTVLGRNWDVQTLKNRSNWIAYFDCGIKKVLDEQRVQQPIKNRFIALTNILQNLADKVPVPIQHLATAAAKENDAPNKNKGSLSFSSCLFPGSDEKEKGAKELHGPENRPKKARKI